MKSAIYKTLCYSQVFRFPLRDKEIHQRLIEKKASLKAVRGMLKKQPSIKESQGYYYLEAKNDVARRIKREAISDKKVNEAKKLLPLFKHIKSIMAVYITGAVAVGNAFDTDDIDLLIITKPNRLWTTRFLVNCMLDVVGKRRKPHTQNLNNKFCLNLWLTTDTMRIKTPRQNLYNAYEITQARVIYEKDNTHRAFLYQNRWIKKLLPNTVIPSKMPKLAELPKTSIIEPLLYQMQKKYMQAKRTREKVAVNSAFFHPRNTAEIVLKKYDKLSRKYTLFKMKGYKRVLVTGVFDVLHKEHKIFLKKAKQQGDYLIVGLESDVRVKKMKGADRPIHSQEIRKQNIINLRIADEVFILPEQFDRRQDHEALIKKVSPSILAVSSHTNHLKEKTEIIEKFGGQLVVVHQHNPRISSTISIKESKG